jgi:predicted DnaQ family exonuclease/DinG family helicase
LRLDQSEITDIFAPGGKLSRGIAEYESRPQQVEFARQVLDVLKNGGGLVIEAATGVGKSIGYLIPSVAVSLQRESPVIVSTNTKNLQEQLIEKDIPVLGKVFGNSFSAAALKGRRNYVCLRKWRLLLEGKVEEKTRVFVDTVSSQMSRSSSGDLAETACSVSYQLWEQVASDPTTCLSAACPHAGKCYWRKARRKASQANVVIVNHSLLFSDVGCERTLLPEHDTIIMDEAHNVERVATEHFGVEVSPTRIRRETDRLVAAGGLLSSVRKRLRRRLPKVRRLSISSRAEEVEGIVGEILRVGEQAFSRLPELLADREVYVTVRFGGETTSLPAEFEELSFSCSRVEDSLEALLSSVKENSELLSDVDDLLIEISGTAERWRILASDISFLWEASRPEFVYWIDQRQREEFAVKACPVWVKDEMREHVFSHLRSLVLTSATMAVAGSLDHFTFRMGLDGDYEPRRAVIDSPFDYSTQVTVAVPQDFVDPRHAEFTQGVGQLLTNLMEAEPRKTLVLFTAYDMLREVYDSIYENLEQRGFNVLGQGMNESRTELMDSFRSSRRAILLGTSSFWEGIDLPGEALELLVLVRLPFSVPEDPIVQARSETLVAEGREPFKEYLLPEAVIRLRQGFGRLIRRKTDRGAIIIVDPRIKRASYGSVFEKSLPAAVRPYVAEELPWRVSGWFRSAKTEGAKPRSKAQSGKRG